MLGVLKRWFKSEGPPPLLVRLRNAQGFVEGAVELTLTWQSSRTSAGRSPGRTHKTVSRAAQGLCIIPWGGGAGVHIEFVHPTGRATVRALASDAEAGEARVVWLEPSSAEAPESTPLPESTPAPVRLEPWTPMTPSTSGAPASKLREDMQVTEVQSGR